jgi:hypothetical protein
VLYLSFAENKELYTWNRLHQFVFKMFMKISSDLN